VASVEAHPTLLLTDHTAAQRRGYNAPTL